MVAYFIICHTENETQLIKVRYRRHYDHLFKITIVRHCPHRRSCRQSIVHNFRKVLNAVVFIFENAKTFFNPTPKLFAIVLCLYLTNERDSFSTIVLFVEALQVIPQSFFILFLETLEVSPAELVEDVVLICCFSLQDLDHSCVIVWIAHLEFTFDCFNLTIYGSLGKSWFMESTR